MNGFDEDNFIINSFIFLGHIIENVLRLPTGMDFTTNPPTPIDIPNVSDLINSRGPSMRIDLGLINFRRPLSGEIVENFPLYYLPISHKLLNNFFTREIISKGKQFYPLHDFIMDLLKKALPGGFNKCADMSGGQAFTPPKLQLTVGNISEGTQENVYQYFIHGSKSVLEDLREEGYNSNNFGNYVRNMERRIPHFFFHGQSRGIDQEIKLIDITDPSIKSAVYFRSRSSKQGELTTGLERRLGIVPVVFQTDIKTIGYPFAHIGQLIYIDLAPFVSNPGETRMITANGYYNIHKVTHTFSKNGFFTNLNGIIQLSAKSKGNLDNNVPPASKATANPTVSTEATAALAQFNTEVQTSITRYRNLRQTINASATQRARDVINLENNGFDFRKRQPDSSPGVGTGTP